MWRALRSALSESRALRTLVPLRKAIGAKRSQTLRCLNMDNREWVSEQDLALYRMRNPDGVLRMLTASDALIAAYGLLPYSLDELRAVVDKRPVSDGQK